MVIQGHVPDIPSSTKDLFMVEPAGRIMQSGKGLIAKTLVKGASSIPVRMMNPSEEDKCLYKGTHIGQLCPVTEVKKGCKVTERSKVPEHLKDLYERTVDGMTPSQKNQVAKLLKKYSSVFSESDEDLGRTGIVRHRIDTGTAHPIKQPLRRNPVHMNPEIDRQIDDMLKKNVIQPSQSPWSSGIVLVTKKDGSKRFCVDYRKLNDVTIKDSYPLPRIDETLEQMAGAQWFSCLDLNAGYWQVELEESDRSKTAFNSRRGLFEFRVMPFGLCNAPATFERLMETVLAGLNWQVCLIYLDDIIVHGRTFEDMISNLDMVFSRLQDAGLKLKPRKCQLFRKEVVYLGHVVTAEGVKTDPEKTKAVRDWVEPKTVTDVRAFLGLCSYYRRFVQGFADIAKPLHKLTEKGIKFEWTEECQQAFESLKQRLCQAPVLAHPDFSKEFILDTDASDFGIGAVLSQVIDGQERAIAFASKTLSKAERRYCVTRKELYALVHFVKYFRHYLYGKHFTVRTDHGSLRWLLQFKNPEGQLARWLEVISAYDITIEHRPGRKHKNADGLSRRACKQCGMLNSQSEAGPQINQVGTERGSSSEVANLKQSQDEDQELAKLRGWLEAGEKPDGKATGCDSYFLKALLCQWERLDIKENIIVRRFEVSGTDLVLWQGIIPLSKRREALKISHDIKASGHLGVKKTLSRIRQNYYWPGMQNDVKSYISGCEACNKRKDPSKTKRAPMTIVRSGYAMERIAVDILGPLPLTERGNQYILVIGDYFTKWTECHAMPNMETKTVVTILIDQVISRFGVPRRIHSDQGRQFESQLFSELCRVLQIEKTRTTPYHAMSDGMVERFNKTLVTMLSAYVNESHDDWDEHLQLVMMAYRSTEHETTGYSPNLCMLGRETTCPLDLMYEMPASIKQISSNQWVWELQEKLETVHRVVRQHTGEAMRRQKRYHDSRLSYETFEVSDKVYVFFPVKKVGCSAKLTSFWRGPYEVKEKLSEVLYKVSCGRNGSTQVIHCDRLRKCKLQILAGEVPESSPEIENEPEQDMVPENQDVPGKGDMALEKRVRRKPAWFHDYVFSLFRRQTMAKTKETPRTAQMVCSNCKDVLSKEDFPYHVEQCLLKAVGCDLCKKTFKTKKYYQQHVRRKHDDTSEKCSKEIVGEAEKEAKGDSDWEDQSDFELLEEPEKVDSCNNELLAGRTFSKKTSPKPVPAPRKRKAPATVTHSQSCKTVASEQVVTNVQQEQNEDVSESSGSVKGTVTEPNRTQKQVTIRCNSQLQGVVKKRKIVVEDSRDGELFSSVTAQRTDKVSDSVTHLGDILPDGVVSTKDIQITMAADGDIVLSLKIQYMKIEASSYLCCCI